MVHGGHVSGRAVCPWVAWANVPGCPWSLDAETGKSNCPCHPAAVSMLLFHRRVLGGLDFFGAAEFGHFLGHIRELGAHVVSWDSDVDDAHCGAAQGAADCAVELAFG